MAILCLLLGLLCVVDFGCAQDTTSPADRTPTAAPSQPTTAASKQPTTVVTTSQPNALVATTRPTTDVPTTTTGSPSAATTAAPTVAATHANTSPTVLTTVKGTIGGPQSGTSNAPTNGASTEPPTRTTAVQATNPPQTPPPATKHAEKPTGPPTVSTTGNLNTSPPGPTKGLAGAATTAEPPHIEATTDSNATSLPTTNKTPLGNLNTEPPKASAKSTPTLGPSETPSPRMSFTTAGGSPDAVTPTFVTAHTPSGSSSVPATSPELTTRRDSQPKVTTGVDKANYLQQKNIEVKCANMTNEVLKSFVKLETSGSAICDNEDGQIPGKLDEMLMDVCKAIKPGYHEKQDKCIIRLARAGASQMVITEASIESRLLPKDLYTQMKRNGANLKLVSFDDAEPEDVDVVSIPLIGSIVALAVILLIIAAVYGCWHQRKARKREQRLTEELQTMENGYHDNPTLEVMETSPEMQEKKGGPNGELGDSWIVPLDNLTREDLEEEEDTHL